MQQIEATEHVTNTSQTDKISGNRPHLCSVNDILYVPRVAGIGV